MADRIIQTETLTAIADAIRTKTEDETLTFTPLEMPDAILAIPTSGGGGGGGPKLLGETPYKLTKDVEEILLQGSGNYTYTVESDTLFDFDVLGGSTTLATLSYEDGFYKLKAGSAASWYQTYIDITLTGLTVGVTYNFMVDSRGAAYDVTAHIMPGHWILYDGSGGTLATRGNMDTVGLYSYAFTASTTNVRVRWYPSPNSYYSSGVSVGNLRAFYINKAGTTEHTQIISLSGSFTDEQSLYAVPSGAMITTSPTIRVYEVPQGGGGLPLKDRKVVVFGDSLIGMVRGDTSPTAYIASYTGATVYNVGFGGCRMSVHPTNGYAAFSMWALAQAVATDDWTTQEAQKNSGSDYFPDQLAVLRGINFATVDYVVIHYGTNDFGGGVAIGQNSAASVTNTICGALRYSIETLLTAYPRLKIFISLPLFRFWDVSGTIVYSDTYTNNQNNTLVQVVEAIRAVAQEYNLPIIDGYNGLGINKTNAADFLSDGTHLTAIGRQRFGEYIGSKLLYGGDESSPDRTKLVANPQYFFAETADTINKLASLRTSGTLFVAFITDSHVYTSSNNQQYFDAQTAALNAVCKAIPPDLVVHGGDMTNGSEAKETTIALSKHVTNSMREIGGDNTLILIGNHDGNTVQQDSSTNEARRISENEMAELYRSWNDGFTYAGSNYQGGQFYGYKDYTSLGIRVIRLHSYIEDINNRNCDGGMGGNWGYYADEVTWFTNVALNTNYDILILCHQTLSPVLQGYDESQDIPHRGMQIQQAIDNWLDADNDHKCIGVIHGHVHWDNVSFGKGTFSVIDHSTKNTITRVGSYGEFREFGNGLSNYLTSMSTADAVPTSSYRDVPTDAIIYGRTVSTATQGLWTAIVVNPTTKMINLVRFGAGDDVSINYASADVAVTGVTLSTSSGTVTEGNTMTLTATVLPANATNKSVRWSSSNTAIATVNGGVVTAVSAGSATITVTTVDGGFTSTCTITVEATPKINQLPLSTDTDGTLYNGGQGYKSGYRLNSSGTETAASGKYVTGFIPVTLGQKVTFVNIQANTAAQDNNYMAFYDSSKTLLASCSRYVYAWYNQSGDAIKPATVDGNYLATFTVTGTSTYNLSNVAYFRLSANSIGSTSEIYVE